MRLPRYLLGYYCARRSSSDKLGDIGRDAPRSPHLYSVDCTPSSTVSGAEEPDLAYNADYENIDLVEYLREIVADLAPAVAPCKIEFEAPEAIPFGADRAILVGLIINELVLNAGRYAYPDSADGMIWVRVMRQPDKRQVLISVRDEGIGLPTGFDPATSKRLGTRVVNALSKQLGGEMTRPRSPIGANFTLLIPVGPATQ